MSMTDPIADMFTRIRNAQAMGKQTVSMPASKVRQALADLLKAEGYVLDSRRSEDGGKAQLRDRVEAAARRRSREDAGRAVPQRRPVAGRGGPHRAAHIGAAGAPAGDADVVAMVTDGGV